MNRLVIPRTLSDKARAHLFKDYGEHFLFFLCETSQNVKETCFQAKDIILIDDGDLCVSDDFGMEIRLQVLIDVMNRANREGFALVEGHNHSIGYGVGFSYTDRKGFSEFVPYVLSTLGKPYGATVWNGREIAALFWIHGQIGPSKMDVLIENEVKRKCKSRRRVQT